jgi:hypothetical protein
MCLVQNPEVNISSISWGMHVSLSPDSSQLRAQKLRMRNFRSRLWELNYIPQFPTFPASRGMDKPTSPRCYPQLPQPKERIPESLISGVEVVLQEVYSSSGLGGVVNQRRHAREGAGDWHLYQGVGGILQTLGISSLVDGIWLRLGVDLRYPTRRDAVIQRWESVK